MFYNSHAVPMVCSSDVMPTSSTSFLPSHTTTGESIGTIK